MKFTDRTEITVGSVQYLPKLIRTLPMAPPRKVEYIKRKKTHNGHYCQQCHIYYQGYNHKCLIPQIQSSSPITSEGGGWINPNPIIVKPKAKFLMPVCISRR